MSGAVEAIVPAAGIADRTGTVEMIVPAASDDRRPSGGNHYNRRAGEELRALGWSVHEHPLPGAWPHPDDAARDALAGTLANAEDDAAAVVLVDGMIASAAGELVAVAAQVRPVVVLVHMPFGPVEPEFLAGERLMLAPAAAVVVTSRWTKKFLMDSYGLPPDRIYVASPGADRADLAPPAPAQSHAGNVDLAFGADGTRLLCVAAVTRAKGHDVLLAALSELSRRPGFSGRDWRCTCVGSLDIDPEFAAHLCGEVQRAGLADRVRFTGPLAGAALAAAYASADLLVLPSRAETWGMVCTEALARGVPVMASDVGGIPEALGCAPEGSPPGLLVPAGDPHALAAALAQWLDDPALRRRLRAAARVRQRVLPGWDQTAGRLATALSSARTGWAVGRASKGCE